MRLIIDVPDTLVAEAYEVAMSEAHDYARRYSRPGWGWMQYRAPNRYWVRGIKGGLSISLCREAASPAHTELGPGKTPKSPANPFNDLNISGPSSVQVDQQGDHEPTGERG